MTNIRPINISTSHPAPAASFTSDDLIEQFLADSQIRQKSKDRYRALIRIFFEWVNEKNYILRDINLTQLLEYKKHLEDYRMKNGEPLSSLTINSRIVGVKVFYNWAESKGLSMNPARFLKSPKRTSKFMRSPLSVEECTGLLEYARRELGPRDYAIINLILRCGLRTIEICRLDCGDIKLLHGKRVIWVHGKGHDKKDMWVRLTDKAFLPIKSYVATRSPGSVVADAPLFVSESPLSPGGRLTPSTISEMVKSALRAIGLDSRNQTAHSLRHSAGTHMMRMGATMDQVKDTLRHVDKSTTEGYVSTLKDEMRLRDSAEELLDNLF